MQIDKFKLQEYAEIKNEIKRLEEKASELLPDIVTALVENDADNVKTDFGTFTISKRRVWTYPKEVVELEDNYKKAKKQSEQLGTAKYDEVPQLKYFSPKENDSEI